MIPRLRADHAWIGTNTSVKANRLNAFRFIMRDRRFGKIPKVLETPKGKELKEDS